MRKRVLQSIPLPWLAAFWPVGVASKPVQPAA
jgi:hypothetical protein